MNANNQLQYLSTEAKAQFICTYYPARVFDCINNNNHILVVFGDPAFGAKYLRLSPEEYTIIKAAILREEVFAGKSILI